MMDADKIAGELSKRGLQHADDDAAYKALDDTTKTVLAEAMLDFQGAAKSVSEAEMRARASTVYKDHLAALARARRAANRSRVNYDVYKIHVELTRSNFSTERALLGRT